VNTFQAAYGAKFPKAVAKITDDLDELLAFYHYPAEHWIHLRTTNPIGMAFKLIESAQTRWRAVNAPHPVALVRTGARFEGGKHV
jgi:transposase-like protein